MSTRIADAPPSQPTRSLTARAMTGWAVLAGIVSAVATLAVAEIVSLFLGGVGNPVLSVGSLIIDIVPPGVKSLVIELFDTADKLVLFVFIGMLLLALAAAIGILQARRPPWGLVGLAVVAALALLAAVTRAEATVLDALPTVVGAAVGMLVLGVLARRLARWRDARPSPSALLLEGLNSGRRQYERRSFLSLAIAVGATSAIVGLGARLASASSAAVSTVRGAIRLPVAATRAPVVGADADLDIPGISPFVTPTAEFYRIDTALQVPSVDPSTWRLRITGMVEQDIEIGFDELLALPLEEHYVTLACVSNEVGGTLIGNALWLGYPIRELLARAKPLRGADMVLSTSVDGFTAGTPLEVLQDADTAALLAVGMNGSPLTLDHGFPVRMVVPGLYGYVSATKWVVELEVTRFADTMGYWTPRGWSALGPVKVSSRIDTARKDGRGGVAGVAWAQHTGISKVEVRVDDGEWQEATLARAVTVDSWLQWSYEWDATPGEHVVTVRATDANGLVQTADEAPPAPDGSTGLHRVRVTVP